MVYHKVRAGLDKDGRIIAWDHHIVSQQIMEGTPFEKFTVRNGIDALSIEGIPDMPYAVPNISIAMHPVRHACARPVVAVGRPYPHGTGR